MLLRNPLYHWTHLELKRYFGIDDRLLGPDTAQGIWERDATPGCASPEFSCRGLHAASRVSCWSARPTTRPTRWSTTPRSRADDSFEVQVLPAWRPDKGMAVEDPPAFNAWVDRLAAARGRRHQGLRLLPRGPAPPARLLPRDTGCRLSDHGLETAYAEDYTDAEVRGRLRRGPRPDGPRRRRTRPASSSRPCSTSSAVMDHEKGWTQQFHFGALRNNNTRMLRALGPDTGFDSIGDLRRSPGRCRALLDRLDRDGQLARTILYNLNPRDNALLATMLGNFQDGSVPGKMQFGSGWWFLDQKDGMERQLEALSQTGAAQPVRRHAHRQPLVPLLHAARVLPPHPLQPARARHGSGLHRPTTWTWSGGMVRDICYHNAARYFGFELPAEQGAEPAQPAQ